MRTPRAEPGNPSVRTYLRWHNLEQAPVSYAAQLRVRGLERAGIACDQWRDGSAVPLLYTAAQWNYVSLVEWLLSKGCSLAANDIGRRMLALAEHQGYAALAQLLAQRLAMTQEQPGQAQGAARRQGAQPNAEPFSAPLEED